MGRYFKYAFGEIVLVMVGILLPLQVNNWKENQKIKRIDQSLIKDLKVEIMEQPLELQGVIDAYTQIECSGLFL